MSPRILFFFLLVAFPCLVLAETAYVEATQDNTLYQSPGGLFSNGMLNVSNRVGAVAKAIREDLV